jgi:hypothetical protein
MLRRIFAALAVGTMLVPTLPGHAQSKPVKVEKGKPAPDFSMTGVGGNDFRLSERIGGEKNVVLMFSRASW